MTRATGGWRSREQCRTTFGRYLTCIHQLLSLSMPREHHREISRGPFDCSIVTRSKKHNVLYRSTNSKDVTLSFWYRKVYVVVFIALLLIIIPGAFLLLSRRIDIVSHTDQPRATPLLRTWATHQMAPTQRCCVPCDPLQSADIMGASHPSAPSLFE